MMASDTEELARFFNKTQGHIERNAFEQILEMDDNDADREFSKGIVSEFLDQVDSTSKSMEEMIKDRNLSRLSELGHFLKGSSATLGLTKVKDQCEKIQHLGAEKAPPEQVPVVLKDIQQAVESMKKDVDSLKSYLKILYGGGF